MARSAITDESNFELALLGYNRQQVDRHLDQLEQRMADAAAVFDTAIALQNQLNTARREIRQLREDDGRLPATASVGERITAILAAAEAQAAAIREQAQRDVRDTDNSFPFAA